MTTGEKALWTLAGIALVGCILTAWDGIVDVRVMEKTADGTHLHILLPGILVPATLELIPAKYFRTDDQQMRHLKEWAPAVVAAADSLARIPDTVLVEVKQPDAHVTVRKSGRSLVTDVEESDDNVHVSMPVRLIASTMEIVAEKQAAAK